jgi:pyruvate,orthophosphate dikinase
MPGMMDILLNLGLNDATVHGMGRSTGDERFTHDSHRRFIQAFGEIVLKAPGHLFDGFLEEFKGERGVEADTELTARALKELVGRFRTTEPRLTVHSPLL